MSVGCCSSACSSLAAPSPRFRKLLWAALVINAVMCAVEIGGGLEAGSASLLADAADFASDAANYAISLLALAMGPGWRTRAALVKGWSMAAFGLFVLGKTVWAVFLGASPEPLTMGAIAVLALLANGSVAAMFYAFRNGDANMHSVWLCSRNDAIGNLAVLLAAAGVFGTGNAWPDLGVALLMGGLALSSGISVLRHARRELARQCGPTVLCAPSPLQSRTDPAA